MTQKEFQNVINEILQSDEFVNQLRNCIGRVSTGSVPTGTSQNISQRSAVSPPEELRRLFPSIRRPSPNVTNSRAVEKRTPKRNNKQAFVDFKRDVFLVKDPHINRTLSGRQKSDAYANGYAISLATFQKDWSEEEILHFMENLFFDKLNGTKLELLIPFSGTLVKPKLAEGSVLDGTTLCRLSYQKTIYVRPLTLIKEQCLDEEFNDCGSPVDTLNDTGQLISYDILQGNCERTVNEAINHNIVEFSNHSSGLNNKPSSSTGTSEIIIETNLMDDMLEFDTSIAIKNSTEISKSLVEALKQLHDDISSETVSQFNIFREDVFNCAIRALRRKTFSPLNKISVIFTDIDNVSEGAVDLGGPTKEMFRLLLKYLQNSALFEGPEESKNVALCNEALEANHYYEAGRIISLSLVHGGPSPNFLSETLFNYLVWGVDAANPNLDEIVEVNIKQEIEKVQDAPGLPELQNAIWESSFMAIAGFKNVSNFEKKDQIVQCAVKHYLIYRVMPALKQFKEGLNTLQLLSKVQDFVTEFKELMCHTTCILTAHKLYSLFNVKLSESGSNQRNVEGKILSFWNDYLLDCEEGNAEVQLKDILCFTTALEQIPPMGFDVNPQLEFLHGDFEFLWPKANTCTPVLYLPVAYRANEYGKFKSNMDYAILNGAHFGFA